MSGALERWNDRLRKVNIVLDPLVFLAALAVAYHSYRNNQPRVAYAWILVAMFSITSFMDALEERLQG